LDKINWVALSYNNFSQYLSNIEKEENKQKMAKVFFEINSRNTFPSNISSCLAKDGYGYLEMLSKYT